MLRGTLLRAATPSIRYSTTPDRKQPVGRLSYAYAMYMTWPNLYGARWPALLRLVLSRSVIAPRWPTA